MVANKFPYVHLYAELPCRSNYQNLVDAYVKTNENHKYQETGKQIESLHSGDILGHKDNSSKERWLAFRFKK